LFLRHDSHKRHLLRAIAFVLTLTFTWTSIAWSAPGLDVAHTIINAGTISAHRQKSLQQSIEHLSIPFELGQIEKIYIPPKCLSALDDCPLIIYLQDAHANLSAQQNIQAIAHELSEKLDVHLLLTEGASGVADISELRAFQDQAIKKLTVDFWGNVNLFNLS